MPSPRLRATIVLTTFWAVIGAAIGLGVGLIDGLTDSGLTTPLWLYLAVYTGLGTVMGVVAGALFSAALAAARSDRGVDGLRTWRWGLGGGVFGAISGLIGFVTLSLVATGTLPVWREEILFTMLTGAGVGAVAGVGLIAIARRAAGPALPSRDRDLLGS